MLKPFTLPIHLLLCLVLSILASFPGFAENQSKEKWYQIEIIVFSQQMEGNFEEENWQTKPGYPKTHNSLELFSPSELLLEDSIENLTDYLTEPDVDPENEDTLESYVSKLENSSKYRVHIHRSWQQILDSKKVYLTDSPNIDPVIASDNGEIVENGLAAEKSDEELLMQALLEEEKKFSQPLTRLPFFISELDTIQPFEEVRDLPTSSFTPLTYEGPPQHMVYGFFKLTKGRYLHMELDFLYRGEPYTPAPEELSVDETFPIAKQNEELAAVQTEPVEIPPATEIPGFISKENTPLVGFRIQDSKRVRLNNIYYFDHPLFGVIVRVNSYTPPPPEENDETEISAEKLN